MDIVYFLVREILHNCRLWNFSTALLSRHNYLTLELRERADDAWRRATSRSILSHRTEKALLSVYPVGRCWVPSFPPFFLSCSITVSLDFARIWLCFSSSLPRVSRHALPFRDSFERRRYGIRQYRTYNTPSATLVISRANIIGNCTFPLVYDQLLMEMLTLKTRVVENMKNYAHVFHLFSCSLSFNYNYLNNFLWWKSLLEN